MRIGVPRESKDQEFRVGMTPDGARMLVQADAASSNFGSTLSGGSVENGLGGAFIAFPVRSSSSGLLERS